MSWCYIQKLYCYILRLCVHKRIRNGEERCDVKEKYRKRITKIKFYDPFRWERDNDPFRISEPFSYAKGDLSWKIQKQKLVLSSGFISALSSYCLPFESCVRKVFVSICFLLLFCWLFHTKTTINFIGKCICYCICVKHLLCEGQIYLENKLIRIEMHFAPQSPRRIHLKQNFNAKLCCATILTDYEE